MSRRAAFLLPLLLAACTPPAPPRAKISMTITVGISGQTESGPVKVNGQPKGNTPLDLDALALPFDPALKPKSWPPPGSQPFSPTVAQHGREESILHIALDGDIVYVRTFVHGVETTGGLRINVSGNDGGSLEFDAAEKSLGSGLGRAEHGVRLWYKKRR